MRSRESSEVVPWAALSVSCGAIRNPHRPAPRDGDRSSPPLLVTVFFEPSSLRVKTPPHPHSSSVPHLRRSLAATYCAPVPRLTTLFIVTLAFAFARIAAAQTVTLVNPTMNVGHTTPVGWQEKSGNGKVRRDAEIYYSSPASLSVD